MEHFVNAVGAQPDASIADTVAAITWGGLDPRQLVERSVTTLRSYDEHLNVTVAAFCDQVGRQLSETDDSCTLPLKGIPVAVKDTFALPWRAPRDGTGIAFRIPGRGASDIYRRLRAAGAIVLYATNMHQLGFGTTGHVSADGPCRNPWNPELCAGGSSGGSAVAVAVGAVPLAIGTDAAGSVRVPAAYCGVVGLKPTWGGLGHAGASSPSTLMSIGIFTRDSADCRTAADALLGRQVKPTGRPRVIGIPDVFWADLHPDVEARCRQALNSLRAAGFDVVETKLDVDPVEIAHVVRTALSIERRERLSDDWRREVEPALHPTIRAALAAAESLSAADYAEVAAYRTLLCRQVDSACSEVDVLAWPAAPAPPPALKRPRASLPSGEISSDQAVLRLAGLANLTGIPAMSMPCGFDRAGLPVGLGLHARWGGEHTLLNLAHRFEMHTEQQYLQRPSPTLGLERSALS
ncbi:amidase [Mycolicibacterium sp.]|uniref:amidase n=1 Tax=Mycolicibacterium sp. TaxID=2320850 RepID=UPI0037CC6435